VVEKRKPLTRRQVIEIVLRQDGRCACPCKQKLQPLTEGCIDEHLIALELGGSNDMANRALYRTPCAKAKTATKDAPAIGKVRRIEARLNGTRRARKPIPSRPFPEGKRTIPSRPFEKREKP
jgi:5-methylcytosine-specific restriction protein A